MKNKSHCCGVDTTSQITMNNQEHMICVDCRERCVRLGHDIMSRKEVIHFCQAYVNYDNTILSEIKAFLKSVIVHVERRY